MKIFDNIKEKGKDIHNKHFKHFVSKMPPITKKKIEEAKKKKIEEHKNKVSQAIKVHKENTKSPTYNSVFVQTNQPGVYNIHKDISCNEYKKDHPLLTSHELAMNTTNNMITKGYAVPPDARIINTNCKKNIETFLNSSFKPVNTKQKKINEVLIVLLILAIIITFLILIIILYRLIKKKY